MKSRAHQETTRPAADSAGDSNKLLSLLALATGAAAMPQSGVADIIYHDLRSDPPTVGFSGGSLEEYALLGLPGAAQFVFSRQDGTLRTDIPYVYYHQVLGVGANALLKITTQGLPVILPQGASWDQGGGTPDPVATVATAFVVGTQAGYLPGPLGYEPQYLALTFNDTSQGGAVRYGWIEVGLMVTNYPVGPDVTIYGYAYDPTGLKPTMGQVPEPAAGGLLALGALALGARGLRHWRKERSATQPD